MINRILVALFFIPLLIWIYLKGDLTFLLFTNVIVGVGLYEFYRMMKQANKAVALEYGVILGMVSSTLMYSAFKGNMKVSGYLIPIIVFVVGSLFTIRVAKKQIEGSTEYIGNTLLGILYIPLMFLHAYSIKTLENGGGVVDEETGEIDDEEVYLEGKYEIDVKHLRIADYLNDLEGDKIILEKIYWEAKTILDKKRDNKIQDLKDIILNKIRNTGCSV